MATKRTKSDEELLQYLQEEAARRFARVTPTERRNAMVSSAHDNMRSEFLRILTANFQEPLAELPRAVAENRESGETPVSIALRWFGDRKLYAPWLQEVLTLTPPSWWQTVGGPVRFALLQPPVVDRPRSPEEMLRAMTVHLGSEFVEAHSSEVIELIRSSLREDDARTPPILDPLPPPRPWAETRAAFLARCDEAFDANEKWAKTRGFRAPAQTRRRRAIADAWPNYIDALLSNRLMRVKLESLNADGKRRLSDVATLKKRIADVTRRLELGPFR